MNTFARYKCIVLLLVAAKGAWDNTWGSVTVASLPIFWEASLRYTWPESSCRILSESMPLEVWKCFVRSYHPFRRHMQRAWGLEAGASLPFACPGFLLVTLYLSEYINIAVRSSRKSVFMPTTICSIIVSNTYIRPRVTVKSLVVSLWNSLFSYILIEPRSLSSFWYSLLDFRRGSLEIIL